MIHLIELQDSEKANFSQALVAHAYNPSYSGGRDQEDHNSKPDQGNSFMRHYLKKKNPSQKRAGLSSSPSTDKKKKANFVFDGYRLLQ
jgi:hypothetical protein